MNTLEAIIEKVKNSKSKGKSGIVTLELDIGKCKEDNKDYRNFYEAYGFLWGLYAAGRISETERKNAIQELLEL